MLITAFLFSHVADVPETPTKSTLCEVVGSPRMAMTCAIGMPVWILLKFSCDIREQAAKNTAQIAIRQSFNKVFIKLLLTIMDFIRTKHLRGKKYPSTLRHGEPGVFLPGEAIQQL